MKKYLFAYSISPVQAFIAQARKIQDLYAGSTILSSLIEDTMRKFMQDDEIIFPGMKYPSKPNRITAILNTDDPYEFGTKLESFTKNKFKEYIDEIYDKHCMNKGKPSNFDNQVNNFLQVRWCYVPYNESDYKDAYKKLEELLNATKNIREFAQMEESGRKCSLCGERNALVYNTEYTGGAGSKKNKAPKYSQHDSINLKDKSIAKNEGLCSICFAKRFFNKGGKTMDSTASISTMDLKYFLGKSDEGSQILTDYKNLFAEVGFNEEMLYPENINEEYFKKVGYDSLIDKIKAIKDKQDNIYKFCKSNKKKIKSYYAIIAFDGDSMGKWMSGEKIREDENLKEFVGELSKKLGEYALWVSEYLKYPSGRAIYAGGEDYLAFINLDSLFETIKELRLKFDEKVNEPLKKYYKNENDNITFSAGIVIAHYKSPLSNVLNYARNMTENAKELDGKNAFSIAVIKRSGEICKTRYKWFGNESFIPDMLAEITKLIDGDIFSDTFMKNIEIEFKPFENDNFKNINNEIINCETERLIKRSYLKKDDKNKENDIEKMQHAVKSIYSSSGKEDKLVNFFSMLDIADFCGRVI